MNRNIVLALLDKIEALRATVIKADALIRVCDDGAEGGDGRGK